MILGVITGDLGGCLSGGSVKDWALPGKIEVAAKIVSIE